MRVQFLAIFPVIRKNKEASGESFDVQSIMKRVDSDRWVMLNITKQYYYENVRKGMAHDRIPNSILRLGSEELAPSLTSIYNNCIDACYWPIEWKKGEWTPVHKKDSIYEVKNYRPITLLPACERSSCNNHKEKSKFT